MYILHLIISFDIRGGISAQLQLHSETANLFPGSSESIFFMLSICLRVQVVSMIQQFSMINTVIYEKNSLTMLYNEILHKEEGNIPQQDLLGQKLAKPQPQ